MLIVPFKKVVIIGNVQPQQNNVLITKNIEKNKFVKSHIIIK